MRPTSSTTALDAREASAGDAIPRRLRALGQQVAVARARPSAGVAGYSRPDAHPCLDPAHRPWTFVVGAERRRHTVIADPTAQRTLLKVQALDTRAQQLAPPARPCPSTPS